MDIAAVADSIANAYVQVNPGRPSTISDSAVLEIFLRETAAGTHFEPAAELAGVSSDTMRNWLNKGKAAEQLGASDPHALLYRAYKTAEASVEAEVTRNIIAASRIPAHWAAGATYVERKHPERWGRPGERQQGTQSMVVHVHGVDRGEVTVGISQLSPASSTSQSETFPNSPCNASESDNRSYVTLDNEGSAREIAPSTGQPHYPQLPTPVWSNGATGPEGTHRPPTPAGSDAAETTKSISTLETLGEVEGRKAKRPAYGLPAVERDPSQVTKTDRKYANPAAARRAAMLHAEGKRKRRAARTATRLKDAIRYAAQKQKAAQKDEAALPEDVIG